MEMILQAKLKSSKPFRDELLATGNKILIEARQDVWWGSGMSFKMKLLKLTHIEVSHHDNHAHFHKVEDRCPINWS